MSALAQAERDDLVLETARLRLRRFRREDADAVFAIIGDDVAMQYYPKMFNRRDAGEWVERNLRRYAERGHGLFAVMLKDSDEVIGDCGVIRQIVEGKPQLEVGYHFRRDQWGHGYATEAARACMGLAFRRLGAAKVISLIRPENVPSRRVAERNGMKIERQITHWGLPHLVYVMRREEYESFRGPQSPA
ncbi:MAG TPA: GNAT family N-acetyltransferase [Candidatus Eisenbacteria bacterium]|nr:GNAT family N-acetyltransferase [Candidatus Eisenbacteria bacterium]